VRGFEQVLARFGVPEDCTHQDEERDGQQREVVQRGKYEVGKESELCRGEEENDGDYRGQAQREGNRDAYGQRQ